MNKNRKLIWLACGIFAIILLGGVDARGDGRVRVPWPEVEPELEDTANYGYESTKFLIDGTGRRHPVWDGMNLAGKRFGRGTRVTLMGEKLKDIDFSGCKFQGVFFCETDFENCDFSGAEFRESYVWFGPNVNIADANFQDCYVRISPEQLRTTRNWREKRLDFLLNGDDYSGCDFSGFHIRYGLILRNGNGIQLDDTYFEDAEIDFPITKSQLMSAKNYRKGIFNGAAICDGSVFVNLDISGMIFNGSRFHGSMSGTRMENTRFFRCDFRFAQNLTLEQVKSTWNYKNGMMQELRRLPTHIADALKADPAMESSELTRFWK